MEERYDRQLRLWNVHGQKDIMNSTVLFAGSDCTASEFLKTMILHGIQNVIIVDDSIVDENDIATNFFVRDSSIGKYRAEEVAGLLNELNPTTKIETILKSPNNIEFMNDDKIESMGNKVIVITCGNKSKSYLSELSDICRERKIVQAHIQTNGYLGVFYIDAGIHHFFEGSSCEEKPISELRIANPFKELSDFWDSIDFDKLGDIEHAHIPYCAILYKASKQLKEKLKLQKLSFKESSLLRKEIESMERNDIDETQGLINKEECFEEALDNIPQAFNEEIPILTKDCFEFSDSIGEFDEPFWQLVRSTQRFYNKHGVIPHYGGCPDMETTPAFYQKQKSIYIEKSKKDWLEIAEDLKERNITIDETIFERFKKNVWRIGGVKYLPIRESILLKPDFESIYDDSSKYLAIVQLLFIGSREFIEKYNRFPVNTDEDKQVMIEMVKNLGAPNEKITEMFVEEFCRTKGDILPSVVASFSAILAEEITKIIIHQAHTVSSVVVFDGVHSILKTQ